MDDSDSHPKPVDVLREALVRAKHGGVVLAVVAHGNVGRLVHVDDGVGPVQTNLIGNDFDFSELKPKVQVFVSKKYSDLAGQFSITSMYRCASVNERTLLESELYT